MQADFHRDRAPLGDAGALLGTGCDAMSRGRR